MKHGCAASPAVAVDLDTPNTEAYKTLHGMDRKIHEQAPRKNGMSQRSNGGTIGLNLRLLTLITIP